MTCLIMDIEGWSSLVVHPHYQRKGVSTSLLRYGLNDLNMHSESLFVNALFLVVSLYARFVWKPIGEMKEDLSKWLGENAGFGAYKNVIMARAPSEALVQFSQLYLIH